MASRDKRYYCPNCGQRLDPARFGGSTNLFDVLKLAVVIAGIVGGVWLVMNHR
jgi:hypothetical protein